MISNFLVLAFGIVTRLADNLVQLAILRFFVGIGVGGIVIPFDLLMEVCSEEQQGK